MAYDEHNASPRQRIQTLRAIDAARSRKATEHLLGICNGLIADSRITAEEVLFLQTWLGDHAWLRDEWPGKAIAHRIDAILDDGFITQTECSDLLETLRDIVQTDFTATGSATADSPVLPIDDDPSIFFRDMIFCFTGRFAWGTRATCERSTLALDATVVDNVTQRLNYLVIGSMLEPTWLHTTFGRKILKAVEYRDAGHDVIIVSEAQWAAAIDDVAARTSNAKA